MTYDVVLFTDSLWAPRTRPYGAFALASTLRLRGFTVLVIDQLTSIPQHSRIELLKAFVGANTLFVGYSSSLFMGNKLQETLRFLPIPVSEFVELNTTVKALNAKTKVVFGGSLAYSMFKHAVQTNDCLGVDYVVNGYAEGMALELAHKLKNNKPILGSKFHGRLQLIDNDPKAQYFDFHNSAHEWAPEDFVGYGESLPLETARGCVFKCKFCAFTLLGKNKGDDSYIKSEESLYQEMSTNYAKWGTKTYTIVDDTFNERTDKIEKMLRVRDRLGIDLTFVGYNRLDMIARKPEQLQMLKDLGFKGFFFGIESLHNPSAKAIGKGMPSEEAVDLLHKIRDVYSGKVSVTGSFILGLPHETQKTAETWLNRIVQPDFPIQYILLSRLHFTDFSDSKSEFHLNAERYGYNLTADNEWTSAGWNSKIAQGQVDHINQLLHTTGRQKIPVFSLPSYVSLGHRFDDLVNVSVKDTYLLRGSTSKSQTKTYVQNLLSLRSTP